MAIYYIHTTLPLNPLHEAALADGHARSTNGNALAVITNVVGTECLIKVVWPFELADIIPVDLVPLEVLTNIEVVRALLASDGWVRNI